MRTVVPGFQHRPGVHCGSTAMADALRTVGVDLSEPMAFGLGSGIYFVIFEGESLNPTTMFFGRSIAYEHDLCRTLGVPFDDRTAPKFDEAWPVMRRILSEGRPVLLVTDIKYLPHYATSTHFNGHRIVLAGFDDDEKIALVADTQFEGLQPVSYDNLRLSMESDAPPVTAPDCSFALVERPTNPVDLHSAARSAIRQAAEVQLEEGGFVGVEGIERLARSAGKWAGRKDWSWCARFGYQVIEKRGNGGGLFRRLYSQFLNEAGATSGDSEILALAPLAIAAADAWTRLAVSFKEASEASAPDFATASSLANEVAAAERRLWTQAVETIR